MLGDFSANKGSEGSAHGTSNRDGDIAASVAAGGYADCHAGDCANELTNLSCLFSVNGTATGNWKNQKKN